MLLAVGSWRGSPGATTAAIALTEHWAGRQKAYLAECDPRGGTIVTRCLIPGPRRLAALAGQARHGGDLALLDQHAAEIPSGARCLTGPEDGRQLRAALKTLVAPSGLFEQAADDANTVLIADVGRIEPDTAEAAAVLMLADVLVLAARPVPDQILAMSAARDQVARLHDNVGLLLIGPGYPAQHVAELLGLRVFGQLPLFPTGSSALLSRLKRAGGLAEAAAQISQTLDEMISGVAAVREEVSA